MKEEKESIFPFRRKSTNRLSLHLDRKKEKKEDGKLKRASWSSFPLLRFSSSSSTSSSTSSSPAVPDKRGFGRKCNSSEEIKHLENKHSNSKGSFQRGSNASIRSSISTSSASSTSSSVRTGGSSSITSILEGSGSDTFSCDSYNGNASEQHNYPVNRTSSDIIHPKRYDQSYGKVREGRDECLSLPSFGQDGGKNSITSPRIVYAHKKTQDIQHRSRKQLVRELEAIRRTGSLPGGLEENVERPKDMESKIHTQSAEKTKPKHKKSFSFIHNSKFLGRLEARTKREEKAMCEEEVMTDYRDTGCGDKETTVSSVQPLVPLHHSQSSPVHLHHHLYHHSPTQLSPPLPPPPPPPRLDLQPPPHQHHHDPSPPQYNHVSPSPSSSPHTQYPYHHNQPVTIVKSPPPPPFLHQTDGQASPPQYSLAAFLNEAFGANNTTTTNTTTNTNTTGCIQASTRVNKTPIPTPVTPHNTSYSEAFNPRYLETSFDSPSDFVIERNYANLLPEIREIYHQVLLKGKDPRLPLSRSEYGDLELKQNFLGVIGDTIEEEEEDEGAESESEIGELLCQVDSTCFERTMEDKLEEMAGKEEEGDVEEIVALQEGEGKVKKRKGDLKLKLVKPQNNMIKRVQKDHLLRHISEENEAMNSAGEEEVEIRTPSTPRSPAIDIDNAFELKHREIAEDSDEMSRLRDLTTRLQLTTRRPSYLDWAAVLKERGKKVGEALATHTPTVMDGREEEEEGEKAEEELSMDRRKHNLQTAVDWVRKELTDMRQQDQQLARQLLKLRVEVQRLRLLHSCLATSCLLEEVASGAEEAKMLEASDLCDLPPDLRETFSPVLREMGLTRMNITSRRFSLR